MQINSCVNPFIYATTIPDFKRIVRDICKGECFAGPAQGIEMTTTASKSGKAAANRVPFCEMRRFVSSPPEHAQEATGERVEIVRATVS